MCRMSVCGGVSVSQVGDFHGRLPHGAHVLSGLTRDNLLIKGVLTRSSVRPSLLSFQEAMAEAMKRQTFGKALVQHQLIRFKLAEMLRQIESLQDRSARECVVCCLTNCWAAKIRDKGLHTPLPFANAPVCAMLGQCGACGLSVLQRGGRHAPWWVRFLGQSSDVDTRKDTHA